MAKISHSPRSLRSRRTSTLHQPTRLTRCHLVSEQNFQYQYQGSEPCNSLAHVDNKVPNLVKLVMPSRYYRRNFIKGYFYHIYNRGANKGKVFWDIDDYRTFIDILAYYLVFPLGKPMSILNRIENKVSAIKNKVPNLVEDISIKLCAYCLMPNHFHLILKQHGDPSDKSGVTNLMRRMTITYSMYIKKKYDRSGTLFQGKFKNVFVETDGQLQQLSKYIHKNPTEIQGSEPLNRYRYSSYRCFIGEEECQEWLSMNEILSFFPKKNRQLEYKKFVMQEEDQSEKIKSIILE